tara:strand:+ start:203 stop:895 length:693 start_codon:yes stop_codon:yes gene_type:complete
VPLQASVQMKSNPVKFFLLLIPLLLFQGWLMVYHQESMIFAELPVELPADVVINDGGKNNVWTYTKWIPHSLERKFFQISQIRRGSIHTGGKTLIDEHVELKSITEFIMYLPRALQVGLLSPFPEFWSGEGSTSANTMGRKIVGVVTFAFYFILIGFLYALFVYRKSALFWTMLLFCLVGILLYSYTSANTGTIVRTRYGFYMLFVSFGCAHLVQLLQSYFKNRAKMKQV